jgi:hypothetical protein
MLFGMVSFDVAGAGKSDHQLLPLTPMEIDPFFSFEPGARNGRFVAANLFARSLFGEEVGFNVTVKIFSNGKITKVLRI